MVSRGEGFGEVEVCYQDVLVVRVGVLNAETQVITVETHVMALEHERPRRKPSCSGLMMLLASICSPLLGWLGMMPIACIILWLVVWVCSCLGCKGRFSCIPI